MVTNTPLSSHLSSLMRSTWHSLHLRLKCSAFIQSWYQSLIAAISQDQAVYRKPWPTTA